MSESVQSLLAAFDHLAADERREFVSEVLRRAPELAYPPLGDEALDRLAEEAFLDYDARESADAAG